MEVKDFNQKLYDVVAKVTPLDDDDHRHEFLIGRSLPMSIAVQLAHQYWLNMLPLRPSVKVVDTDNDATCVEFFTYDSVL